MNKVNKLAAYLTSAVAVAALFGTSAFAESRHHDGTERGGQQSSRQRGAQSGQQWRGSQQSQPQVRQSDRGQVYRGQTGNPAWQNRGSYDNRGGDRNYGGRDMARPQQQQTWRNDGRVYANRGAESGRSYQRYDNRGYTGRGYDNRGYTGRGYDNRGYRGGVGYGRSIGEGRVSRILHERGGYRVWLDGGRYPYWVPEARWGLYPLSLGLSVRFGGVWDPLGYWSVSDFGPMGGPYYTNGDLRGVVESVDYRSGAAVVRDDLSGAIVTVALSGGDPRLGDLRPGDYVDLSGSWARNGVFSAYGLQDLRSNDDGGYARY